MLAMEDLNTAYQGAIIPHLIIQELISLNQLVYSLPQFWVREKAQSSSEVDIVLQHKGLVIPIEVKSGKIGKLKSLLQFMDMADHPYAIRMYARSFSIEKHETINGKKPFYLMNLPYYCGTLIYKYIDYFVANYRL